MDLTSIIGRSTFAACRIVCVMWALVLLALTMSCTPPKPETARSDTRPNIFLLSVDSMRADFLGCYGHPLIKTPHLDKIAKSGITLSRMFCSAPYTVPSLASLLTALYPQQHNARNVLLSGSESGPDGLIPVHAITDLTLNRETMTWASFMKERGYATVAVVGGFTVTRKFSGLDVGFDTYDDVMANLSRTADEVIAGLQKTAFRQTGSPLFCWSHFFDAHFPYSGNSSLPSLYAADVFLEQVPSACQYNQDRLQELIEGSPGLDRINQVIRQYAACLSLVDARIGQLVQQISAVHGTRKNYIIITSDHGEGFTEHCELFDHGVEVFNTTTNVPCLISCLEKVSTLPPVIVPALTRNIDIWPTMDDFLGYALAKDTRAGRSFKPLMSDPTSATGKAFIESKVTSSQPPESRNYALITGEYKFVLKIEGDKQSTQLFELDTDPGEHSDVSSLNAERMLELESLLSQFRQQQQKPDPAKIEQAAQDDDTKDKLRSLGYLGD